MVKSKARTYLDKDRDLILWLFDGRCVRPKCRKPTNIIHEIRPISHGRKSLHWKNRITLCNEHHAWAHESTKKSIPILENERKEFLIRKFGLGKLQEKESKISE